MVVEIVRIIIKCRSRRKNLMAYFFRIRLDFKLPKKQRICFWNKNLT